MTDCADCGKSKENDYKRCFDCKKIADKKFKEGGGGGSRPSKTPEERREMAVMNAGRNAALVNEAQGDNGKAIKDADAWLEWFKKQTKQEDNQMQ